MSREDLILKVKKGPRKRRELKTKKAMSRSFAAQRIWMKDAMQDEWYRSQMPVSVTSFYKALGIYKRTVQTFLAERSNLDLSHIIDQIERRALMWSKKGVLRDEIRSREKIWRAKLTEDVGFDIHAKCLTCSGNKWLPVIMNGKTHIFCYTCIPPSQWPSLGAVTSPRNLIAEHIERSL